MDDKILWSNFDRIFGELEAEALDKGEDFYQYTYDRRAELIKDKVTEYITKIEDQKGATLFPTGPLTQGEEIELEEEEENLENPPEEEEPQPEE